MELRRPEKLANTEGGVSTRLQSQYTARAPSPISSLEMCMSYHCLMRIADTSFEILNGNSNRHVRLNVLGKQELARCCGCLTLLHLPNPSVVDFEVIISSQSIQSAELS